MADRLLYILPAAQAKIPDSGEKAHVKSQKQSTAPHSAQGPSGTPEHAAAKQSHGLSGSALIMVVLLIFGAGSLFLKLLVRMWDTRPRTPPKMAHSAAGFVETPAVIPHCDYVKTPGGFKVSFSWDEGRPGSCTIEVTSEAIIVDGNRYLRNACGSFSREARSGLSLQYSGVTTYLGATFPEPYKMDEFLSALNRELRLQPASGEGTVSADILRGDGRPNKF